VTTAVAVADDGTGVEEGVAVATTSLTTCLGSHINIQ
jgi:hypothetical protein